MKQKVMIVNILFMFLVTIPNVYAQTKNDNLILIKILSENDFSQTDSLSFEDKSSNKLGLTFFKRRATINYTFKLVNEDENDKTRLDSSYQNSIGIKKRFLSVTKNDYLGSGKGVDLIAEDFLKDNFNSKKVENNKWVLSDDFRNVFNKKYSKTLKISKPVYNVNNNKAIIFMTIVDSNFLDKTIYFFENKNSKWSIVFQERNVSYPMY